MDARGGLSVIVGRKRCGVVAMVMTVLLASYAAVAAGKVSEPVDYVSPNIGTIGQLLTATGRMYRRRTEWHGWLRLQRRGLWIGIWPTRSMPFLRGRHG